jgi:hypothetical protein
LRQARGQSRLFLGVKQALGRSWSFDLGYMLGYQPKASGYQYDLNHTSALVLPLHAGPQDGEALAPPRERRGVGREVKP